MEGIKTISVYQDVKLVMDNKVAFFPLSGVLLRDNGRLCPQRFPLPSCGAGVELAGNCEVYPLRIFGKFLFLLFSVTVNQ